MPTANIIRTGIAFGVGYAVARWASGGNYWGGGFGWGSNNIHVNRSTNINVNVNNWQHNPVHRRGVAYANAKANARFGDRPSAPGGALNYVVKGTMIGGFALVAYPAEYGNTGVMTFLVNYSGVVFQKDFGPETGALAQKMTSFNPDKSWEKADTATAAR